MVKKTCAHQSSDLLADTATFEDWRHPKLLKSGETDGFKWHIGEYQLPLPTLYSDSATLRPVRLAYVDVTGTKLEDISEFYEIDDAEVDLHGGCTFVGGGQQSALLRTSVAGSQSRWYIGEDYAHANDRWFTGGGVEDACGVEAIEAHIKTETIPSIIRALVKLDLANPKPSK